MKKFGWIALMLALMMCLSFTIVGCNEQNDDSDSDQDTAGDQDAGDDTTDEGGDDTTDE